MHISRRGLRQEATYWPSTSDGYGGYTFGSPALINCRWEDKSIIFTTPMGKEEVSRSVVIVEQDMNVHDWLCLGDQTATADPTTIRGACPIRLFQRVPDLRNLIEMRRVVL